MSLHLFDSATHEVRPFTPLVAGKASIYLCGATVQGVPHVGHARSAIAFDVLVRWLRRSGLDVTLVRNVTDIDDKILSKATDAGVPWWAWAYDNERAFTAAYDALGVLPPTYEPRATGHVPEMIELMQELIAAGHAYQGGQGDVFFDVRSWADYGELTHQRLDDVAPEDSSVVGKRDPRDFALWKAPKPGEPEDAAWDTPFGRGRPGWHLECSAMARRYLGRSFDIHGGGLDLRFPHHENELAQSRAAGDGFAATWLHNGLVTSSGSKMSKSSNNFLTVAEQLEITPAIVLRYALTVAQYRSQLEWSEQTLADATAAWARIDGFVERASAVADVDAAAVATAELPAAFVAAMDDDLNVPAAIAVVHETVRSGNAALAAGADVRGDLLATRAMLDVLGVDPGAAHWSHDGGGAAAAVLDALDALVADQLAARAAARTAKEWALADSIRDRLAAVGIQVEDSADGARWSVARREAL